MYDLIIIGGGPAGLTAAVYAIRKRLNVLLVTHDLGGKTNYNMTLPWMETHQVIRGTEIVDKFRRELEYLDFAHRLEAQGILPVTLCIAATRHFRTLHLATRTPQPAPRHRAFRK